MDTDMNYCISSHGGLVGPRPRRHNENASLEPIRENAGEIIVVQVEWRDYQN